MGVVEILIKAKDLTGAAFATTKAKLTALKTKVATTKAGFSGLGSKISGVMSAAIVPIMLVVAAVYAIGRAVGGVLTSFGDFDTAMKGVQKTTGMAKEGIEKLGSAFKAMSAKMPLNAKALAEIGVVAGQLGIQGVENIKTFTETVAKVSVALQMTAEEAATSMAKIGNAFQLPVTAANDFASAINSLENTTAAAGSEIIASMTRMAASGAQLGLTVDQAAALGATLISTGMAAERVGTRLNRAFTEMAKKTKVMAEQMGVSNAEMRHSIETDVMGAFNDYLIMLSKTPSSIDKITKANEVFGAVGGKAIAMLSTNYTQLQTNLQTANVAMQEGTSLHEEYLVFASSFEAQMTILKNKVNLTAIAIGEKLAPAVLSIGTAFTDTIIPGFATFSEEIGKQTSETWPNFTKSVNEAFAKITGGTTFQTMMEGLGNAVGIVLDAILIGITAVIDAHGPLFDTIGKGVGLIADFLTDLKDLGISAAVLNLFSGIATEVGTLVGDVKTVVHNKLSAIKDGLAGIISPIVTAIATKFGAVKGAISEKFEGVKTAVHAKLGSIKDGLTEVIGPIITAILTEFASIKDDLEPVLDPIKTIIHAKLGSIKDGLAEKLAPVKTAIEGIFTSAIGVIETKFEGLPASIGNIFISVGETITTFGESLPGFLGTGISDLGNAFSELGDAFTTPSEGIKADITDNIVTPLETDVPAATISASTAMDIASALMMGHMGIVGTAVNVMKGELEKVPESVDTISDATDDLQEDVKEDLDKVTVTVDGVEVSFDGLKGKVGDVVGEFGNFEDIASDLIGLDWSVFTTLKDELPGIDKGIGDMKEAFSELKDVLDDNIDNLADIQTDLGDIEKTITPFVKNIAPGIKAIGEFGTALSDTQKALSTFASMKEVDIKGMLGFSTAIHSMVSGLKILEGQMENLVPSFAEMSEVTKKVSLAFVAMPLEQMNREWENLIKYFDHFTQEGVYIHNIDKIAASFGITTEQMRELAVTGDALTYQLTKQTNALKNETVQLTKISDAIQPLIGFMQTLGTLLDITIGEKAFVSDLATLDEMFAKVGDTVVNLGLALKEVDLGTPIKQLIKDSAGFRTSMEENGGELAMLMAYIDTLLGYYVDLGEQMVRLTEIQDTLGDSGFDVGVVFAQLKDYISELTDFTPILATALGGLSKVWGENSGAINDGVTAFHGIMTAIGEVKFSIDEWITAENNAKTATDAATDAVNEESDALAGHSLTTALDATSASSALLQAATTALAGAIGPLSGAVSVVAAALSGELVVALGAAASAMARLAEDAYSAGLAIAHSFADGIYSGIYVVANAVSALGAATRAMGSIAGDAYSWGQAVAYNYADGIYSGIGAVEEAASALADVVASYLEVHSNTELGALSDLMDWGPNVVKTFKEGIQGEMVSLTKTLNDMSLGGVSISGATSSSSGGGNSTKKVYMTINQNISSKTDADYAVREIERLMKKPQII